MPRDGSRSIASSPCVSRNGKRKAGTPSRGAARNRRRAPRRSTARRYSRRDEHARLGSIRRIVAPRPPVISARRGSGHER